MSNENNLMIKFNHQSDLHVFKDVCLSALRYAISRHSYIIEEVSSFVKDYASIILDKRVISVMLKDIDEQLEYYRKHSIDIISNGCNWQCDIDCLESLKEFLVNYDKL